MRITFADETHASRLAKSFRKALSSRGVDLKLSAAQDLLARTLGHARYQELLTACRNESPSPMDDALPADDVLDRRQHMINNLFAEGIDAATARAIIDETCPTGRRHDGKVRPQRRADLVPKLNADGFLWWEETKDVQSWFERKQMRNVGRWPFGTDGATLEIDRGRDQTEDSGFRSQCIRARLRLADGSVGAAVHGFVFLADHRYDVDSSDFYSAADSISEEAAALARALIITHDVGEVFAVGDLFWMMGWETAVAKVPSGTGIEFLRAVLKRLKASHRTLTGIAVDLRPAQFSPSLDEASNTRVYQDARQRLLRYWDDCKPWLALGPRGTTWHYFDQPFESEHDSLLALAEYGFKPEELAGGAEEIDRLSKNPAFGNMFNLLFQSMDLIHGHQPKPTVTLPSEPKCLPFEEWPRDRSPLWGMEGLPRRFNPAEDFWSRMPSEVSAITVDFYRADLAHPMSPRENKPWRMTFRFANGTELMIHGHEFFLANRIPPALLTGSAEFHRVNPFTTRMSTGYMFDVLRMNAGLLFVMERTEGPSDLIEVAEVFRDPNRPTVIRRPKDLGKATAARLETAFGERLQAGAADDFIREFCSMALRDGWLEQFKDEVTWMGQAAFKNRFEKRQWQNPDAVTVSKVINHLSPRTFDGCPAYRQYFDIYLEGLAKLVEAAVSSALKDDDALMTAVRSDLGLSDDITSDRAAYEVTRCPTGLAMGSARISAMYEAYEKVRIADPLTGVGAECP